MVDLLRIDGKSVGGDRCYVISELGHNHGGSVDVAKKMIKAAAEAGADAVKFQIRSNKTLFTPEMFNAPYNSENAYGATYGAHREALELSEQQLRHLQSYASHLGITMFATAFDIPSVDVCDNLGFPAIKLASADLTNTPLIRYASSVGVPLIISTGGANTTDIHRALQEVPLSDTVLMQCTASYPADFAQLDLGVIANWLRTLPVPVVGASLHDNGIAMAVAAYCMGARVIEKHLTLDRTMKGTDHAFSLEPQGFAKMVRDLRRTELALGDTKTVYPGEVAPITKMSKSVYAAKNLEAGHVLTAEDVTLRSPGGFLPPYAVYDLIGKKLDRSLVAFEPIPAEVLNAQRHPVSH